MEAYWPMIGGKLLRCWPAARELGRWSRVQKSAEASFREYGYSLGLAFQVLDDWLGIWGDQRLTGKSVESDLASGKKTLPVLYGVSKEGAFARRWMKGGITPDEVPTLRECWKKKALMHIPWKLLNG